MNRENIKKLFRISLAISILFHVFFMLSKVTNIFLEKNQKITSTGPNPIKIVLKEKSNNEEIKESRQIVTTTSTNNSDRPKDSKFLGEKDQTVDRQTVARKIGQFKQAGKGDRSSVNNQNQLNKNKNQAKEKVSKAIAKQKPKNKGKGKKVSLSDLAFNKQDFEASQKMQPSKNQGQKNGAEGNKGLAQANDFIEDIPLGDMTNLNTVEYKYYGFYHRIKMQLEQHWGNSLKEKASSLYKTGRRLPASENLITSLTVVIDGQGNIKNIHVKGTSGVRELDQAAIESFNKAGPFPNPPKGMLTNGTAKIEWGFVVKG